MLAFGTHARNQMWCVVLWFSLLCVAKAAKVITRQMQMGLVAEKKSKPNDQAEDYEDAAEGSSKPKPKSKAKAKAKAKGKPKAKATGKAKAKSTKRLASASAGPSETEQEERGPEEPEELDAPPPENDEDLGEASPASGRASEAQAPWRQDRPIQVQAPASSWAEASLGLQSLENASWKEKGQQAWRWECARDRARGGGKGHGGCHAALRG